MYILLLSSLGKHWLPDEVQLHSAVYLSHVVGTAMVFSAYFQLLKLDREPWLNLLLIAPWNRGVMIGCLQLLLIGDFNY